MRRVFALLLVSALFVSLFAGCGLSASAPEELEKGFYELTDEDGETVAYITSTGKKLTVTDTDGAELLEETRFTYDDSEKVFLIDGDEAFSLSVSKNVTTMTVPKKSPLGISRGEYTLQECDEIPENEETGKASKSDSALPDACWYELRADIYVRYPIARLYVTETEITVYDNYLNTLMEASRYTIGSGNIFLIDDTKAMTLDDLSTGAVTIPGGSPLGIESGSYLLTYSGGYSISAAAVTEDGTPYQATGCRLPDGIYAFFEDWDDFYYDYDANTFIIYSEPDCYYVIADGIGHRYTFDESTGTCTDDGVVFLSDFVPSIGISPSIYFEAAGENPISDTQRFVSLSDGSYLGFDGRWYYHLVPVTALPGTEN